MMRGKVILLVAAIAIHVCNIFGQEDLVWISTIEENKFSSLTDSIPVKKEENFHLESDTSTNIHFTYYWDNQSNDWIKESKSIGIFDKDANRLEMQNYYWDGSNAWTGSIRYFFWYDTNGEIPQYRNELWDHSLNSWIRNDSLAEQWESDGLIKISEEFSWNEGGSSWELTERRRLEKNKNAEGYISEEFESKWDIPVGSWIPISQSLLFYDGGGNLTEKSTRFWLADEEVWFEYLRHEFSYDSDLDMWLEERYEWDFLNSNWGLRFRGGVSNEESQVNSYMIGLKDDSFQRWQIYEKVESEIDDQQLVVRSLKTSKDSEFGEWQNKSQTQNFYDEEEQAVLVTQSTWRSGSGTFEVDSKKYFFYPGDEIANNIDIVDNSYRIFPNPTSNNLHIIGPNDLKEAYIFDLQGKFVLSFNQMEIDVSYLPAGLYMIRILGKDGSLIHLRFIKI